MMAQQGGLETMLVVDSEAHWRAAPVLVGINERGMPRYPPWGCGGSVECGWGPLRDLSHSYR